VPLSRKQKAQGSGALTQVRDLRCGVVPVGEKGRGGEGVHPSTCSTADQAGTSPGADLKYEMSRG